MYRYNNHCYANPDSVYEVMASDCPVMTSDGLSVTCTPTLTGYTIAKSDGVTTSTIDVVPVLQDCTIDFQSIADLNANFYLWLLVAVAFIYMRRAAR